MLLFLENLPEIIVSAIIVAIYGIIDKICDGIGHPLVCPTN
jgi:hypothetical protein